MYLKSINNVEGYKDLPDGFNAEFDENITYIIGANFQRKTTVGSLFNWCLTGRTLLGNEKESVANDKKNVTNVLVDITFVDNNGAEHRLIRNKSKTTNLILDGKQIEQDGLAQFYTDRDVFLAAYNPYFFFSLQPQEQRKLLGKIIPPISSEEAFELLNEEEKHILEHPIESLNVYTDDRNKELSELEKEYTMNVGSLKSIKEEALKQEGDYLTFDKELELEQKIKRYEFLESNSSGDLEELQKKIETIDKRINEIINDKLQDIAMKFKNENEKYRRLNNEKPICSTCKQEIKDSDMIKHLKASQLKTLTELQNKANLLQKDATYLNNEKKEKLKLMEQISSPDIKKIEDEKKQLKQEIEQLQVEQQKIIMHNNKVQVLSNEVKEAKNKISILEKAQNEILEKQRICKKQKDIANKLKILIIEKQNQEIQKYLNKVEIQFSKIRKTDNNVVECCIINYEGREYRKLSKSQQARTNLEISNLFNKLSKIQAPIFFDDAESTTDIDDVSNTQMIISLVVKDTPLEILYDYNDVLLRKQNSIEKELENGNSYMMLNAA